MKENKKITVIGKGMLGTDVAKFLERENKNVRTFGSSEINITQKDAVRQLVDASDIIINCAAYTNVDGAEKEKNLAYAVNATAVGYLGEIAATKDVYLLHISTDFVYDGQKSGFYTEKDTPNPINTYGKSKLEGERLLQNSGCRHSIIRVEWTYGENGIHFIRKICDLADKFPQGFKVVDDQVGSPTPTIAVAEAVGDMIIHQHEGLFLYATRGTVSRFDIATFVFRTLGKNISVNPCKTSAFPTPAKRPLNSRFDCHMIDTLLTTHQRPQWKESLLTYLEKANIS